MIKYLFIVINSFVLFVYGLFSGDNGITVKGNIPSQMSVGQETTIEITINKGSMNGFAKLQVDLPEGFTVKESDEKGATYTFNEGIAKWVWAALPSENEITIKMVVIPGENSTGAKTFNAKYSYVENNVKQVVEMTPSEITVLGAGGELTAVPQTSPEPTPASTPPDTAAAAVVTSNIETPGNITVDRHVTQAMGVPMYTVTLSIKKGATKGFARYSDDLPQDVQVTEASTDGASFSVADEKIKFVWVNVPDKETLEISYVISSTKAQTVSLVGEYSYLEDNQSKKYELKPENLVFEISSELAKVEEKKEEPVAAASPSPEPVAKPAKENKKEKKSVVKSKPQAVESDEALVYHVQIGAFSKRKVTAEKLEKRFKVSEAIKSDMQGGFSKFMVGSHQEYKEARDHRESMVTTNGIKSSFVVAYNHGKRITVQEALMISNQKWFK